MNCNCEVSWLDQWANYNDYIQSCTDNILREMVSREEHRGSVGVVADFSARPDILGTNICLALLARPIGANAFGL